MNALPSPDSMNVAVRRALATQPRHNVGNGGAFGPARLPFQGILPGPLHNVGAVIAGATQQVAMDLAKSDYNGDTPPQGIPGDVWHYMRLLARKLNCNPCNLLGGTPAFGYGGGCPAPQPPALPVNANGCAQGWVQCKQPLNATALAVAAGAAVPIVVTPRRVVTPYQFIVTRLAAPLFVLESINIDGVEYNGQNAGPIPCDAFAPDQPDHSVSWADFSSTTPLTLIVRNVSLAAADFRSAINAYAVRG